MMRVLRALFGLALLLPLLACGEDAAAPVADEALLNMKSDNVVIGLRHRMTTEGRARVILLADTAYMQRDSMEVVRPRMEFFDENGTRTGDLVAKRGFIHARTEAMTVRGGVVLNTVQGDRRIQTEELHFDPQADRIWSDVATTMRERGTVLSGTGFTADAQMTNVRVVNPRGTGLRIEF